MINPADISVKIKYEFLENTSDLFSKLLDKKFVWEDTSFWPTYILTAKMRDNELCFSNIFCYFEEKIPDKLEFKARYCRNFDLSAINCHLSNNLDYSYSTKFNNERFYTLVHVEALNAFKLGIDDIIQYKKGCVRTIYQYYDFDDFKNDFPFYIPFYNKELIRSIKNGDFWKHPEILSLIEAKINSLS